MIWSAAEYQAHVKNNPEIKSGKDYKGAMWTDMNDVCSGWVTEHKFCPTRKWRADYAHVEKKIIVEYEGVFSGASRHTNRIGYSRDCGKYNFAQIMGYRVLRYTAMNAGELKEDLKRLIESDNS